MLVILSEAKDLTHGVASRYLACVIETPIARSLAVSPAQDDTQCIWRFS